MEIIILLALIILAFIGEYIDSSLGMGYGTILAPVLIIVGFNPLLVIPSILFSQAIASFSAAIFHQKYKNISLGLKGENTKSIIIITCIGTLAIILTISISIRLPQAISLYFHNCKCLEIFIGIIVIAVGIILLGMRKFNFSWKTFSFFGFFSVFIKSLTGGGFGPIFTSGQIISGKKVRSSIGLTTVIEVPICLFAFFAYIILNGFTDFELPIFLCVGALLATPFGPYRTTKLKEVSGRKIIGILTIALGIFLIIKNFIWPYILTFIGDPFFWALISMFALIGSSVTLVSKQLRRFPLFNMALVAIFTFGRFILPLPFCQQPLFEFGGWQFVIGGIIFTIGLIFLVPLIYINPFPSSNEKIILETAGYYNFVRNPIYLGEILWSLGWAIMFGSIIGVALVPLWWGGLLFHVILEEEDLERKFGKSYLKYKQQVRGRIIPGLPI